MSKESIVERILSDANAEAEAILADAREKADLVVAGAEEEARKDRLGTEAEVRERRAGILEGKAAAARLDSAKILLAEKRRVIDAVYGLALKKLLSLGEKETLALAERLLQEHAEEGDVILFAPNYPCANAVTKLAVFREKKLKLSFEQAKISGGFILRGENSDKNLSYEALLAADREEHQAEIAEKIFITG